jgi:transcriptional regulator with XRE-family HTH domain
VTNESHSRRSELADFLRARRGAVQPTDVGISAGSRRRVSGLRREEVAHLSGVSHTWYSRLEQGRDVHPTTQVIDSIAATLRLSPDEHLRRLAGLPLSPHDHDHDLADESARRLLEQLLPAPAVVIGPSFDYLAWNDAHSVLFCDIATLPADRRNVLWATFTVPAVRRSLVDWSEHAQAVIGQFRAEVASRPGDPRHALLIKQLAEASVDFRNWWPTHRVRMGHSGIQSFQHPSVGLVTTDLIQLRLIEQPSLKLVVQLPATPQDAARLQQLQGGAHWRAHVAEAPHP